MKNLLLFFDAIAILLPRYMAGRETASCGSSSRRRSWTSRRPKRWRYMEGVHTGDHSRRF
jgi:hypothetical protein